MVPTAGSGLEDLRLARECRCRPGSDHLPMIRRVPQVPAGIRAIARALDLDRKTVRRCLRDDLDFNKQLQDAMSTVADVRVHGTTHERPIDRFAREYDALVQAPPGRAFRLEAPLTRVVATDYLVTVDTNRYSVPFTLIGQPVEVMRRRSRLTPTSRCP